MSDALVCSQLIGRRVEHVQGTKVGVIRAVFVAYHRYLVAVIEWPDGDVSQLDCSVLRLRP